MIDFLKSLFGIQEPTRMVVGTPVDFTQQDAAYLKASNARLKMLQDLCTRYQHTSHAGKMQEVFDKTERVHTQLLSRKRVQELELFHLQFTDHFISAFTTIMDAHERHQNNGKKASKPAAPLLEEKATPVKPARVRREARPVNLPEMVKPMSHTMQVVSPGKPKPEIPRLYAPDISINTFEKINYYQLDPPNRLIRKEVGFTSSQEDKEAFQLHICANLGLEEVTYLGNAPVTIPNGNGINPTGLVPIIHWEGFHYAINLNDYRLFPVRLYRKG